MLQVLTNNYSSASTASTQQITMSTSHQPRKSILVVSASRHLTGVPIEAGIKTEWAKEKARHIADHFDNVGFNIDPKDVPNTLKALRHELVGRSWDGVILGWCIRGHVEFTLLFEEVVAVCCDVKKSAPEMKIMFSTGGDNIVETVARNFPMDGGV
ncbi:hypothetical protein LSUE1_G002681 [Lachnellula suecica]|uniref:Uncharacterized protein n=1 Tax=Lachnellula suecica TaxID=602035 RepID=A0A8T9CA29_9HELO|nr:hypothetical protein LSUE1_G002681 [Lachnellula suecica]